MKNNNKAVLASIIGNSIFGFSYMFTKVVLDVMDNYVMLSVRFIIAFLIMTGLLLFGKASFDFRKKISPLLILGFLHPVLYFTLETYGIAYTNSVITGSLVATVPIISMVMAAIFLKEHFLPCQLLFAFISFSGVVLISISGQRSGIRLFGIVILLAAVVVGTGYSLVTRKLSGQYTAFERTYVMFALGAVAFTTIALITKKQEYIPQVVAVFSNMTTLVSMIYLAVMSSVVAFFCLNYATTSLPVAKTTSYTNLGSVVSMVAGAVFLSEPVGFLHITGCALILTGVILSNITVVSQKAK